MSPVTTPGPHCCGPTAGSTCPARPGRDDGGGTAPPWPRGTAPHRSRLSQARHDFRQVVPTARAIMVYASAATSASWHRPGLGQFVYPQTERLQRTVHRDGYRQAGIVHRSLPAVGPVAIRPDRPASWEDEEFGPAGNRKEFFAKFLLRSTVRVWPTHPP